MAKGRKTGGRKRGTPNKLTTSAKEAFQFAFNEIGGDAALSTWARDNTTEFYRLFARLIPSETKVSGETTQTVHIGAYVPPKDAK